VYDGAGGAGPAGSGAPLIGRGSTPVYFNLGPNAAVHRLGRAAIPIGARRATATGNVETVGPEFEPALPPGSRDAAKALRAAADPARPGEKCLAPPGRWTPVIDREKCEGKKECVDVCPYSVFELGTLTDAEFETLSLKGKFKARRHDRKTARTPLADACRACGLCVVACPEDAITLGPGRLA